MRNTTLTNATLATFFVKPAAFDLHLLPSAPAIDTGSAEQAPALDADRIARPQGNGVDLGAYEWHEPTVVPADGGAGAGGAAGATGTSGAGGSAGADASAGGGSGSGGSAGSAGGNSGGSTASTEPVGAGSGGCACGLAGSSGTHGAWALMALLALSASRRRGRL